MIFADEEESFEKEIELAEYMASFWNSEAVQKVRDIRKSKTDSRFASDEEFEKQILDNSFKSEDIIDVVNRANKNTNLDDSNDGKERSRRLPKDLSGIRKLFGD